MTELKQKEDESTQAQDEDVQMQVQVKSETATEDKVEEVEAEINAEKVKMEKQEGLKDTLEQIVKDGRVVDEFHLFKVSYQITRIRRRFSATKMKVN